MDGAFDKTEHQWPSKFDINLVEFGDKHGWKKLETCLLGFVLEDSRCGCVRRRWWCLAIPLYEVFWRLKVGVVGSLKFKRKALCRTRSIDMVWGLGGDADVSASLPANKEELSRYPADNKVSQCYWAQLDILSLLVGRWQKTDGYDETRDCRAGERWKGGQKGGEAARIGRLTARWLKR